MKKKSTLNKKPNAGTSMIEVLVAFLVVMLMMAMFAKVVTVSVSLLRQSRNTIDKTEDFDRKYYMTEERKKRTEVSEKLTLVLDAKKTSNNNTTKKKVELELIKGKLQKYTYEDGDTKMSRYSIYVEPSVVQQEKKE